MPYWFESDLKNPKLSKPTKNEYLLPTGYRVIGKLSQPCPMKGGIGDF